MTIAEILDYYANLLIVQYRIKPRAQATVRLAANMGACDALPQALQTAFDLDTAVGVQLDVIGRIVDVPRDVFGLDLGHEFFNFTRYTGTPDSNGFGRYANQPDPILIRRYAVTASYRMTDYELRALIRLKIIYNTKYSSLKDIKEALFSSFDGGIDVAESSLTAPAGELEFFNFTRYQGTPDSVGFGRYADSPYTGYFYRYAYANLMHLTFTADNAYENIMQVADFLHIVPAPMGVDYSMAFN